MELCSKFIIEDGNLVMAKVAYHKDLVGFKDDVIGGGWFRYKDDKTFVFYGSSHEFGKALLEDIQRCVSEGKVFTNIYLTHNISDKYKFLYDTGTELIELN